jgi:hypothetical protein
LSANTTGQLVLDPQAASWPCYSLIAGASNCANYFNITDDPATSANIGMAINVTSTNAPPNPNFNFRYRSALIPSIVMRGASTSVWAINTGVIVDPDANLTGHTANLFEGDVHNRNKGTGDAAGYAGINYGSDQVTGISLTGTGFRSTYALNVDGGSMAVTTVVSAGSPTNVTVSGALFAPGDQIRILAGSAGKGLNGTPGVGKVTAASGGPATQNLTIVWETASPGTPGAGDQVEALGQYGVAHDVVFNRGIGCSGSVIHSCVHIYPPVEIGIDFNGAGTNIGIDFAKMTSLQGGVTPTDFRMGLSHRISVYVAGGTDLPVLVTAGNIGDYTQIADGSGNTALFLGGAAGGGNINYYRNDAHYFQGRGGALTRDPRATGNLMVLNQTEMYLAVGIRATIAGNCSGHPTGTFWNNAGVVNVCP